MHIVTYTTLTVLYTLIWCGEMISPDDGGVEDYSKYLLVGGIPNQIENIRMLKKLELEMPQECMRFLAEIPMRVNKSFQFLLHQDLKDSIEALFRETNVTNSLLQTNESLEELIIREKIDIAKRREEFLQTCDSAHYGCVFDFFNYNEIDKIEAFISKLVSNPEDFTPLKKLTVKRTVIGSTYQGRNISMVGLHLESETKKPAIFIECTTHAREWISPMVCMYSIRALIGNSETLLKHFDFFIVPITNPDGYVHAWISDRMWRKNRNPACGTPWYPQTTGSLRCSKEKLKQSVGLISRIRFLLKEHRKRDVNINDKGIEPQDKSLGLTTNVPEWQRVGVDINRNYGGNWAPAHECSNTFPGIKPFSEPESRAVRDGITSIKSTQTIALFISVHSYSQVWLTNYGQPGKYPPNHEQLQKVADIAESAMKKVDHRTYEHGSIWDMLGYATRGTVLQWAQDEAHINYSYLIEMRPPGWPEFLLPVAEIKPAVKEAWAGFDAMSLEIKKEFDKGPTMGETCKCKVPQDINECCCKDADGDPCCTTECSLPGHQDGRDCVEKGNPNARIGGPDACEVIPHSKPWITLIKWIDQIPGNCGGTLIGSKYVLTAAHCVCRNYFDCENLIVEYAILGDHDKNVVDDGEIKINVSSVIVHPDYKGGENHNADYAILVLETPVKTNDRIKIAKLPRKGAKCPPGEYMVVSGWGLDRTSDRPTNKLWSVLQTCLPDDRCPAVKHDKYTLCAGSLKNKTNTICSGDSGGPLTYTHYKTGETTLYGVVAQYGDTPQCLSAAVYAPVAEPSVLDWIRYHTDAI